MFKNIFSSRIPLNIVNIVYSVIKAKAWLLRNYTEGSRSCWDGRGDWRGFKSKSYLCIRTLIITLKTASHWHETRWDSRIAVIIPGLSEYSDQSRSWDPGPSDKLLVSVNVGYECRVAQCRLAGPAHTLSGKKYRKIFYFAKVHL